MLSCPVPPFLPWEETGSFVSALYMPPDCQSLAAVSIIRSLMFGYPSAQGSIGSLLLNPGHKMGDAHKEML